MDVKDNEVCRICLMRDEELINIFQNDIPQNIMIITSIKIEYDDGFPQFICKNCSEELSIAIIFKNKCEKSYTKLCEYFRHVSALSSNSSTPDTNVDSYIEDRNKYEEYYTSDIKNDINAINNQSQFENITNDDKLYRIISREHFNDGQTELINLYECVACSKQKICLTTLQQHVCDFNHKFDNTIYTCNVCSIKIISTEEYNIHLKYHEEEKCKTKNKFTENIKSTIPVNILNKKCDSKKHKVQQCELCGKITQYRSELIRHMRVHSGERPFKCDICNKSFRCKAFLTKHFQTHAGERIHHCLYCPKSFVLKSNLNQHIKSHMNGKKYACNICNKKFKATRSLHNHIKIHTGERNYPCTICDKAFVNPFDLRRHTKLHEKHKAIKEGTYDKSKEPPKQLHQCEHCGKFVPSRGDLTKHMRVHTKERPYKCQVCGKAFAGTSALAVHNRTHTGAKPYTCHHCGLSFTQSSNLKVHIRLHTGIRPYICTICNKGFNRNRDLVTHLRKHGNDKV